MDIEPLLVRLGSLAPSFGRAREDIEAMISRGRSGDYKGVMQNARLVLEALLRALVSDELKQTPGKAMLDELITKFRQAANAHLIPTNILAHMGTVQAWGNLSSHDHATKLSDDSVTVGKGEVVASLNSMVAILDWYAARFGKTSATVPKPEPVTIPARPEPAMLAPRGKKSPLLPIVLGVLLTAGGGLFFGIRAMSPHVAPAPSFAALDGLYAIWNEPLPPAACRSVAEANLLGSRFSELAALEALPATRSAEAWYLIARERVERKQNATEAATKALGCAGFAAAFNLAGKIAVKDGRLSDALPSFQAALDAAPDFHNARFNLALLHLKEGRTAEGASELKRITAADPKYADAHFFLGLAYEGQQRADDARHEFCAAFDNGKTEAKERCGR
jgi:tetratricopeptide (TPR) repeat protein